MLVLARRVYSRVAREARVHHVKRTLLSQMQNAMRQKQKKNFSFSEYMLGVRQ